MEQSKRLRTAAAAEYIGLAKTTLEKLRFTGGGPVYIKLGNAVVYDTRDIDSWLEQNRVDPAAGT
tara:strand:+ start:246 stop:440 length:195 start_codon:yes stop_codon:yes gene_type:complete